VPKSPAAFNDIFAALRCLVAIVATRLLHTALAWHNVVGGCGWTRATTACAQVKWPYTPFLPMQTQWRLVSVKRPQPDAGAAALRDMLAISCEMNDADVSAHAHTLLSTLLRRGRIDMHVAGTTLSYRLLELEFYLKSDLHADPYAHASVHQSIPGQWHFHRAGNANSASAGFRGCGDSAG
jgi:hypothetical protein